MVNLFKLNTNDLKTLVQYKEVLEAGEKFPKGFWTDEKYQLKGIKPKCRILTRYCLENLHHLEIADLSRYHLKEIKAMLVESKLFGMVQTVFNHDVLALLKNAYPEEFRSRVLKEWMWSKHGLWHNDHMIREAILDMVYREGIRRIDDIPSFDWKKRLIKYNIYNVLSYFNWSIYALFNFVYPNKFHPSDFKYKAKWAAAESLENAFHFMHKTFKKNRYSVNDILLLGTANFRKLGLAGMLTALFDSSTLKAKEYYLYKTLDNPQHQQDIISDINALLAKKREAVTINKLKSAASGKYIYNLHGNYTLYNYIKRHAKKSNESIDTFISRFGFIYKSTRKDAADLSKDEIWSLRKQGLTYVQIAQRLGSNPTTISEICQKHFGGDPLIPRPIDEYITVQELMNRYHVDHKTIMKIVSENGYENHYTVRFRYLKKSEIEPALNNYIESSSHHKLLVNRYKNVQ